MTEIVNLRRARKHKALVERQKLAESNRVKHGTPKRERNRAAAENILASRTADAHRLEKE